MFIFITNWALETQLAGMKLCESKQLADSHIIDNITARMLSNDNISLLSRTSIYRIKLSLENRVSTNIDT